MKIAADGRIFGTDAERFWARVDKRGPTECWPWTGSLCGGRKELLYRSFKVKNPRRQVLAHRYAYSLAHGLDYHTMPRELVIRHRCDNHKCCNPAHLEPGTQQDNCRDTAERGRTCKGAAVHTARLRDADVLKIKHRLRQGERHDDIARDFGVARVTVTYINLGRTWRHVQEAAA